MTQLSKLQSALFLCGGILMVVGACCYAIMWQQRTVCWVFLVGSILFATMQIMQAYEGSNFVVRRLKRIMTATDLLFILAGLLMTDNAYQLFRPLFRNDVGYFTYVYNKWVIVLLIAAVLEMYTMHRISHELKKEDSPTPPSPKEKENQS